jgi:glycosyltransferase involved in cell wall biosynthesis
LKKILWLTSWYPNKLEPLSGDFIERHAKAASIENEITVIHVVKDHMNVTPGNRSIEVIKYPRYDNLKAYIGYYKARLSPFFSLIKYVRTVTRLIRNHIAENGKPHIINVHICYKAGLGALYCKWRYGIPYIISEQWTVFCAEAKPSFNDQPLPARWLIRLIYKNAYRTTAVSEYLADSIAHRFNIRKPIRIPNVVDGNLFYPQKEKHRNFSFIHISVLNYQKSPEHIIEAVRLLKEKSSQPFQLMLFGPHLSWIEKRIEQEKLSNYIEYRGEVPQEVLAQELRKCHSLILYSRFETFGCVGIEAMAAGLPVIASDIPVMREIIQENKTGVFADTEDPDMLADKMLWMMENYQRFSGGEISDITLRSYSFEAVCAMFGDVFRNSSSPTRARLHQV